MKALDGVKILDLSEKLTVSLATMYLFGYGAEVTKLEKPGGGDPARSWQPKMKEDSLYFNYLNGGKKSLTLDITTGIGQEVLRKLVAQYDVICVDTEAGYMDSLGLGYEELKKSKANLIYASCSYYGETGPYKNKAGSSLTVQAKGVAMDMTGVKDGYPVHSGPSIAEHYSAAYLATGIVMALTDREKRGIGQKVDIAVLDSIYSCIEAAPAAYSTVEEIHKRKGNFDPSCAPYDTFETKDGYVAVGVATQMQWVKFCEALQLAELERDPRFIDNEGRRTDYMDVLRPLLVVKFKELTKGAVEDLCRARGIPCSAVLNVREITDLPNTMENGYVAEYESPRLGKLRYPTIPFQLQETAAIPFQDAPLLGQHTEDILMEAGIAKEWIERLKK